MDTSYLIINGKTIHKDLVGSSIVGTKAYRAKTNGYFVCEVCCAMVPNLKKGYSNKRQHDESAFHKDFSKDVNRYSKRF